MNLLRSVKAQALEPQKIEALIHLLSEDLGYRLHHRCAKDEVPVVDCQCCPFSTLGWVD
jgi:hypothetical protein